MPVIRYEFPLTERTRSWLRLENLYFRFAQLLDKQSALEHHFSLHTLFEIIDIGTRADLKSDLLQELERQRNMLEGLRNNPRISENALTHILQEIEQTTAQLLAATGKFGQHIRDNEWLISIKQRMSIPGGACEFDLPLYHLWLNQAATDRKQDLIRWAEPLLPIRDAIRILLRLLRDGGKMQPCAAKTGVFQQMSSGKAIHLIQISVSKDALGAPELSANKYAIHVRFTTQGGEGRPRTLEDDIPFQLTYCSF